MVCTYVTLPSGGHPTSVIVMVYSVMIPLGTAGGSHDITTDVLVLAVRVTPMGALLGPVLGI